MTKLVRMMLSGYPHHITHGDNLRQYVLKNKSPDKNKIMTVIKYCVPLSSMRERGR